MMNKIIDARGFSCPQPVVMTMNAIKEAKAGELQVLVDTDTARENVTRAAASKGLDLKEIIAENEFYRLVFIKQD